MKIDEISIRIVPWIHFNGHVEVGAEVKANGKRFLVTQAIRIDDLTSLFDQIFDETIRSVKQILRKALETAQQPCDPPILTAPPPWPESPVRS